MEDIVLVLPPGVGGSVGLRRRDVVSYPLKHRDSGARCEAAPGIMIMINRQIIGAVFDVATGGEVCRLSFASAKCRVRGGRINGHVGRLVVRPVGRGSMRGA